VSKCVIVAAKISQVFNDALCASGYVLQHNFQDKNLQPDAVGIITSTKLHIDKLFLDACPNLKWICRLGSGMEIIDSDYAQQKSIACFSSAAGIAPAVAEFVLGSVIALQRNIFTSAQEVQQHRWVREANRTFELSEKTIGIIGLGNTGSRTAELLKPLCKKVLAFDKYIDIKQENITPSSLQNIYEQADIVSYHVPLNVETKNYYDAHNFLKPHILINSSRGPIASTKNILQAFESNKLTGACLDVLDFEAQLDEKGLQHPELEALLKYNCLITPHIAGYSFNAIERMCAELQQKLVTNSFL
jgi:D-3-phosphoglycerate dehydrogenase / 2-oxoglutarate reductase